MTTQPAVQEEMSALERLMWDVYEYVRDGGAPIYEGGASLAEAGYLKALAESSQATVIAEIGFNIAFSSIALLEASPDTSVVSFELDRRRAVELAKEFVDERYPGRHTLIIGDSRETVPAYARAHPQTVDMVFVDGGHWYEVAMADIVNSRGLVKPGGLVVVDDIIPWRPWGVGPHQAWQQAVADGLVEPIESLVDGRVVEEIAEPGERAWATGRFR